MADVQSGTGEVTGNIAHDAVDSGNPLKVGAKAIALGSVTSVAANDRTNLYADRDGVLMVMAGHPNVQTVRANYTAAQTNAAIVSTAAGRLVVTRCSVMVDKACSVDVGVLIGFGASTTPTTTGVILAHPGLAAGSGLAEGNGSGKIGQGAAGDDIRITSEVPTGGSIDVVVTYYELPS